jgi:CrcB protein
VGLLGGFTTFSAFANDTVNGLRNGFTAVAVANVVVSVVTCLAAVWLGRTLVSLAWR